MRIAIIGAGIAGNVVARGLYRHHEIAVYEAGDHVGGHSHTHQVEVGGRQIAVDTGFIVYNGSTYPRFSALLEELGVNGTYFCGAYWRYGFHEDGVVSAEAALDCFAREVPLAQRALHRLG